MQEENNRNPLGSAPVASLLVQYAVPSIIAMLVASLYNIVDQFFIGHYVGELGNAATNIAFPFSSLCLAISLMCGIGGASCFNLCLGKRDPEKARRFMGNAAALTVACGAVLAVIAELFMEPLLIFFGSSKSILPYALEYSRITAIGFPALVLSTTGGHLIRADGRPKTSMMVNLAGAIINTILDAVFIMGLEMGMAGAALATIIGQFISACLVIGFLSHARTVKLSVRDLVLSGSLVKTIVSLGMAPSINQLAMMLVQIVLNNSLRHYGAMSDYGAETAIAVVGIATKVNMLFMSFVIGLSHSLQPIASFNYGARSCGRVKEAYKKTILAGFIIALIAWSMFFIFPTQIIGFFGKSQNPLYYEFAARYFRIYMFFTMLNFLQPITSNFFTALGKAGIGAFLSLTRQIIFLLPLIVVLPLIWGIDGIMFAGPAADLMAAAASAYFAVREFHRMKD